MSRMHGKDVRAYFSSRDVSPDLTSIDMQFSATQHDVTTFENQDWMVSTSGLRGYEGSLEGFYDASTSTGITKQLTDLLGSTGILTVVDSDADALGDRAIVVTGDVTLTNFGQPIKVSDITRVKGTLRGQGRVALDGRILRVLGASTSSGNSTSVDDGSSSIYGGRANLHVTAVPAAGITVTVQHSIDDSTYVDLWSFAASTKPEGQSISSTGPVQRYLREKREVGSTAGGTYLVAYARYKSDVGV